MDNNKKGEIAYAILMSASLRDSKIFRLPLDFLHENEHTIEAIVKATGISVEEATDFLASFKRDAQNKSRDMMIRISKELKKRTETIIN